jgi:hypothetical protein
MIRLIYIVPPDLPNIPQILEAGFDGYVCTGSEYRAVIRGVRYEYWDEPEGGEAPGHQQRYLEWRRGLIGSGQAQSLPALVAYGIVKRAKTLGVWHTDYAFMGHHFYPWYPPDRSWLGGWWRLLVTLPCEIRSFLAELPEGAKAVGIVQTFRSSGPFPSKAQIAWQEKMWRWLAGDRLAAIAWFIWDAHGDPGVAEGLKRHPEVWPK